MPHTFDGLQIVASHHALNRARQRVPVLHGADKHDVRIWVEATAADALNHTRTAKRLPRWCVCRGDGHRSRLPAQGWIRYVWNEEQTAVLVVSRERSTRKPDPVYLIQTVMTPDMESR